MHMYTNLSHEIFRDDATIFFALMPDWIGREMTARGISYTRCTSGGVTPVYGRIRIKIVAAERAEGRENCV